MDNFAIAIDGPGGAGKSTVAKALAKRLDMVYVDTGAMYRAIALYNINNGADIHNEKIVEESLFMIKIDIKYSADGQRLFLNGEDVTEALRTLPVARGAAVVAAYKAVREKLIELQRELASNKSVVMDGRDIGSHVLPWAQIKIFLDAGLDARVDRRLKELAEKGESSDRMQVRHEIETRDEMDSNRELSPMTRAEDAVYIDTSDLSLEQVIEKIIKLRH
jgi:cytidylate kinase